MEIKEMIQGQIQEQIQEQIQKKEESFLFPYILQILFLIENKKKKVKVHYEPLLPIQKTEVENGINWIKSLGLKLYLLDNKEVFFITNPNYSPNQNKITFPKNTFENHRILRIIEMKTRRTIKIKINPDEKKMKSKINEYNLILKKYNLPYRLDYQMYSRKNFFEKHKDRVFVSNYLNEYAEILKDEFLEKTRFYSDPSLILQKWEGFQWIMEMIKTKDIQQLYQGVYVHSKEYLVLTQIIKEWENQIITCCS